ncbi:MAG: hypothetical protein F4117_03735 [Acidimicrobiales bacterium]|nr:hypothetical protein [Acidimicrobiaceae bacterium]MXV87742.1 hypothetical protein [Acidimicrobiales bacterium]MXX42773.1 hypothetical protein [Acidimicrobiales bacterium]MXY02595.1 hypothetical protein [Acidimicrobiales bacterium]MXZ14208.1 hypothetical protein [Acidimicrobiales bacterium]
MGTIAAMTNEAEADAAPDEAEAAEPQAATRPAAVPAERERRSLVVPMLSTVVAALIAGVFALAVIGFNTLRDDFNSLRDDIDSLRHEVRGDVRALDDKIETGLADVRNDLDERFARMDERFEQVNATLLDHAERLSRIEAILNANPEHLGDT